MSDTQPMEVDETITNTQVIYGSLNDFVYNIDIDKKTEQEIYYQQYGVYPPEKWSKILIIQHLKEE